MPKTRAEHGEHRGSRTRSRKPRERTNLRREISLRPHAASRSGQQCGCHEYAQGQNQRRLRDPTRDEPPWALRADRALYRIADTGVSSFRKVFQASVLSHSGQPWRPDRAEIKMGAFVVNQRFGGFQHPAETAYSRPMHMSSKAGRPLLMAILANLRLHTIVFSPSQLRVATVAAFSFQSGNGIRYPESSR